MQIKCDYCGNYIDDADAFCGHCGAPNDQMLRSANGIPKTIGELQEFCARHNLPLKQMRFFIGEDYKQPRAFGIYQADDGDFVVYKNKADGSRAIRYEGKDEAYAVNEIYQKLKTEMTNERQARRSAQGTPVPPRRSGGSGKSGKKGKGCLIGCLVAVAILVVMMIIGAIAIRLDPDRYGYGSSYGSGSGGGSSWVWDDDDDYGSSDNSGGSSWLWDDDDDSGSSWDNWSSWDDDWDSSDWDWDSGSDWSGGGSDWDSDW